MNNDILEPIRWVRLDIVMLPLNPDGTVSFYDKKIVLHKFDIPRWIYDRKQWVIRWRTAYYQMKYPKADIQYITCFYDKRTNMELLHNNTYNNLIAAKRMITKLNTAIKRYEHERAKELFWEKEHDEKYQTMLVKLLDYEKKKEYLSKAYGELTNGSQS